MSDRKILHFSLGPVQGFVGQARRTRDYWAGSFLLSYLSGIGMHAIEDGRFGTIEFPPIRPDRGFAGDPLFLAIEKWAKGDDTSDLDVFIGSLPNRFKARLADDRVEAFLRERPCERAIQAAWWRIAEVVWRTFVQPAARRADRERETRAIWDRQIGPGAWRGGRPCGFWEMSWVMGDDPGDGSEGAWLDRRKNWRTHRREPEPGDHCMMMGDWQELSGHVRATREGREAQEVFWNAVHAEVGQVVSPNAAKDRDHELLELGRTERLSAIALVKRLFPILPQRELREALGWLPDGPNERGQEDRCGRIRHWPSTAYVAAAPWMIRAWTKTGEDGRAACKEFLDDAANHDHVEAAAERESRVWTLSGNHPDGSEIRKFGMLGGGFFFTDILKSEIREAEREQSAAVDALADRGKRMVQRKRAVLEDIERLQDTLRPLWKVEAGDALTFRQRKFDKASPFYALLLMDGDSAGALMSAKKIGAKAVSAAFSRFARRVAGRHGDKREPGIVDKHDGVLIYAGGDDVKAFLPLDRAIDCAVALHEAYLQAFADETDQEAKRSIEACKPTISAGLVFAHYHVPLNAVIREAHHLLKAVAKEENGRNSLAISVLKPSGRTAKWVAAFACDLAAADASESQDCDPVAWMMPLARSYAIESERSSSFLYNVRERYRDVFGQEEGGNPLVTEGDQRLENLLFAEWVKGRNLEGRPGDRQRARAQVSELINVCRVERYDKKNEEKKQQKKGRFLIDGGLIAKFLADNGVGVEGEPESGR